MQGSGGLGGLGFEYQKSQEEELYPFLDHAALPILFQKCRYVHRSFKEKNHTALSLFLVALFPASLHNAFEVK